MKTNPTHFSLSRILCVLLTSAMISGCSRPSTPIGVNADVFRSKTERRYSLLNRFIQAETLATWSTSEHTAQPVIIGALGPEKYTGKIKGLIHNTEIAVMLKQAVREGLNVVIVVGDGMGVMHMILPLLANKAAGSERPTMIERILDEGRMALCINNHYGRIVAESASAATAFSSGREALTEVIGLDHEGYPVESVLDIALESDYTTALVTDTRTTHATPAAFYAKNIWRYNENNIAEQLMRRHNIDIIMGGGARHFIPKEKKLSDFADFDSISKLLDGKSKRKDTLNLIDTIKSNGYALVTNRAMLASLKPDILRVFGLFASNHMNFSIDRGQEESSDPSVDEMAEKTFAISSQTSKPLFALFECGRIDHAAHDNDMGSTIKAMQEMELVLSRCYAFYKSNPKKTLLVFTADHETGGLSFSYSRKKKKSGRMLHSGLEWRTDMDAMPYEYFRKLANQKMSYERMFILAKNPAQLVKLFNANSEFNITIDQAEQIYAME